MTTKKEGRGSHSAPHAGAEKAPENIPQEENQPMAAYASSHGTAPLAPPQIIEGVTVTGEAVRRVSPEHAEFVIEITASATTAAQALRDNQTKVAQIAQTLQPLGVQAGDMNSISQNIANIYMPVMPALPAYGLSGVMQPGLVQGFAQAIAPDVQFGSYHARNVVRVTVREAARAGEILDAATRAGAAIAGPFQFKASDEASARRSTLEAAGKDARQKAEVLAAAAGKKIGEPVAISEEFIASNGAAALQLALPFGFTGRAPQAIGELEYYARVSASYRLQ
ncbi:MAG TPA: SIMPL domain-containing protein [Bryobacteraceae bacterium]|nr:SIMPL domain-containing protein [Bryobacteraceae bacterium]